VFAGSKIVSIKRAGNFQLALVHALKYPAKYLSSSTPARLADLELAFHGVRRVTTLGAFYNAVPKGARGGKGVDCPRCASALFPDGAWWPIPILLREGLEDLEEVRRSAAREIQGWAAGAPPRGSPGGR